MNNPELNLPKNKKQNRYDYLSKLIVRLNKRREKLIKISNRYSYYRLFILLAGVTVSLILFFTLSDLATLISFVIFILTLAVVAHFHGKLDHGIKKLDLWIKIKNDHIARLNLDWNKIPPIDYSGGEKINPIERDLNLAGDESLHQLVNTTTSDQASSLLREWLNTKNPVPADISERQKLIAEMISQTRFRDKLTLNSVLSSKLKFNGERLLNLLNNKEPLKKSYKIIFAALIILALINLLLLALYIYNILPAYWGVTFLLYIFLYYHGNKDKVNLAGEAESISDELGKLLSVFEFLENYNYKNDSYLHQLCKPFLIFKNQPSLFISKIKNSIDWLWMRKTNPYVWLPVAGIFPIDFLLNSILLKYKNLLTDNLSSWLDTWYRLESLSSLANFAYLNPEYTFPKILEAKEKNKMEFNVKKIGHPLIKKDKKICNDFSFEQSGEIAIITGSNMSGKSTFIKTLGMNLSLAYAGSVVNAENLTVSSFNIFTCINVSDSVIDGISYFYAEVKRLKSLLNEIEKSENPVFFLIDEIFRGTNNIERLKGSMAYIKKLSKTNAIGALATHDLELVKLSNLNSKIKNYHFKEDIENGKMLFSYRINTGPCPTTNALKIMKLEGLPVE